MSSQPTPAEPRRGRKKAEAPPPPPPVEHAEPAVLPSDPPADAAPPAEAPAEEAPEAPAAGAPPAEPAVPDRRRIEEQLEALERKQAELRRALALADHPELAAAVRALEARADAVAHADEKRRRGLSKAEEKKRDGLEKKLEGLRGKRAELDAQIGELERELAPLGAERVKLLDAERDAALAELAAAIELHEHEITAAGLEVALFVPELARWGGELDALRARGASDVVG